MQTFALATRHKKYKWKTVERNFCIPLHMT